MEKRLYRDEQHKMIGGVCAGLAQYLDMDMTVMRLLFAFAFFIAGVGLIPYIILWIVLPRKTYNPFTTPSDPLTVNYIVPPVTQVPPVNPDQPFMQTPPKRNTGGVIAGMVLILMGGIFLLHQLDVFSFWEMHRFWPVILVVIGIALIISGQQKKPWDHQNWHTEQTVNAADEPVKTESPDNTDNSTNDNNPTV
jgi:phage shock protein C